MRSSGKRLMFLLTVAPGTAFAASGEESLTLMQPPGKAVQPGQAVQPSEELRDIHGPLPVAGQPPYWAIGGAVAVLLAILAALSLYLKKRRKPAPTAPPSPWETALAELAATKGLQSQGLLYMERVGEILRRYIESRFAIRSTRQTTREFLTGLNHAGEHNPLAPYRPELQACLEQADMAKFAHLVPEPDRMEQMERAVTEFVRRTEPQRPGGRP